MAAAASAGLTASVGGVVPGVAGIGAMGGLGVGAAGAAGAAAGAAGAAAGGAGGDALASARAAAMMAAAQINANIAGAGLAAGAVPGVGLAVSRAVECLGFMCMAGVCRVISRPLTTCSMWSLVVVVRACPGLVDSSVEVDVCLDVDENAHVDDSRLVVRP